MVTKLIVQRKIIRRAPQSLQENRQAVMNSNKIRKIKSGKTNSLKIKRRMIKMMIKINQVPSNNNCES